MIAVTITFVSIKSANLNPFFTSNPENISDFENLVVFKI
jgi:hypothetical protein